MDPLVNDPSSSQFSPNTTLLVIVRQMFIEGWDVSFSFEQYYGKCSPSTCKYSTTARKKDFLSVLLTLVSMIGGLSVGLRTATPTLVNTILDFFKPKQKINTQALNWAPRMRKALTALLTAVSLWNIFPVGTFGSHLNRSTAKHLGQWSTRFYILLLMTGLTVLTFRTFISPETFTETHFKPSLNTYLDLVAGHRSTLQCPCSLISSPYSRFLQIKVRFHPVSRKHLFL